MSDDQQEADSALAEERAHDAHQAVREQAETDRMKAANADADLTETLHRKYPADIPDTTADETGSDSTGA